MKITLQHGLTLRRGERTIELVRELDRDQYQFADRLTGRLSIMTRNHILTKIYKGEYTVVPLNHAKEMEPNSGSTEVQATSLGSISQRDEEIIDRRLTYVRSLQAAHISRGQRTRITQAIQATASRLNDLHPPSTSTVMAWARRYQLNDHNPLALLSANGWRKRAKRIHSKVEDVIDDLLRKVYFTRARPSLAHTHGRIRLELQRLVEQGVIPPKDGAVSKATLTRRVNNVDVYQRIASREGKARARVVCRTTFGGTTAFHAMQNEPPRI